jgi:hypothetical protein
MSAEAHGQTRGDRANLRPSLDDRCPECGDTVGDEWVSFRQDPSDPQRLMKHFSAVVKAGPAEPPPVARKRTIRDFHYPDDLGVFFHSSCAPRARLPEDTEREIAELLAQAFVAGYQKTVARWAKVGQLGLSDVDPPKCHAYVQSSEGRRVFTMTDTEWQRLRVHEGKLVEIHLERTPAGGIEEAAAIIAALAADCHVHTERIEIWRHSVNTEPTPFNIDDYLVLENLTARRLNLPMFAERAVTEDSPKSRKYLRQHVFVVKERPDKGRWQPKAQVRERIVFLRTLQN